MHPPQDHDVTNGELFRLVVGLKEEFRESTRNQNVKLDVIERQVRQTNGQVMNHDGRIENVEREVFDRHPAPHAHAPDSKGTISFSWEPNAKTILAIMGALATVVALLIKEWLKR